jgi:hypothetical protein
VNGARARTVARARRNRPLQHLPAARLRDERQALSGHLLPARLPASPFGYRGIGFLVKALEGRQARRSSSRRGSTRNDRDPRVPRLGPWSQLGNGDLDRAPAVRDSHYRTIRDRRGRALSDLGRGYGAVLLALHHLPRFSVVESWSGYFRPTDPSGKYELDLGSEAANARARPDTFVSQLRAAFKRNPTFFAFYVGANDTRFRKDNERLDSELTAAACRTSFACIRAHTADALDVARPRVGWAGARASRPAEGAGGRTRLRFCPPRSCRSSRAPRGTMWQGLIPDPAMPTLKRPTVVYLPPNASPDRRYHRHVPPRRLSGRRTSSRTGSGSPIQPTPRSPTGTSRASSPSSRRQVRPRSSTAMWTGPWEDYVVKDVVPWGQTATCGHAHEGAQTIAVSRQGPTAPSTSASAIRTMFGTLESWSGYFHPYRDARCRHASATELAAHDPTLLVRKEAPMLRKLGTRFYLSSGSTKDSTDRAPCGELLPRARGLHLRTSSGSAREATHGKFWRAQSGPRSGTRSPVSSESRPGTGKEVNGTGRWGHRAQTGCRSNPSLVL